MQRKIKIDWSCSNSVYLGYSHAFASNLTLHFVYMFFLLLSLFLCTHTTMISVCSQHVFLCFSLGRHLCHISTAHSTTQNTSYVHWIICKLWIYWALSIRPWRALTRALASRSNPTCCSIYHFFSAVSLFPSLSPSLTHSLSHRLSRMENKSDINSIRFYCHRSRMCVVHKMTERTIKNCGGGFSITSTR